MIFVRKIDLNGVFIEDAFVDEVAANCIETPCPSGMYLPKWNGTKWVEGKTTQEIKALTDAEKAGSDAKKAASDKMTTKERLERIETAMNL